MSGYNQIAMIIPTLSPDERLIGLVRELVQKGLTRILIVNDGSSEEYDSIFEQTKEEGAFVIRHVVNQGKGRALKTAFNYILENWSDCTGAVSLDSDGQHLVKDIVACCEALTEHRDSLILGCRNFKQSHVPFKSRFGNTLTSKVFKILLGITISDTQTGLRAFSRDMMKKCLLVEGERFEYETNMLIFCKEQEISIVEVPIETVYYENNKSTHFRPIQDSIKIYSLFLKFIFSSLSASLIDLCMFAILTHTLRDVFPLQYIFIGTIVARAISSVYNFVMNRKRVFKSDDNIISTFIKYYVLAVVQMGMSAIGVYVLYQLLGLNETVIKIVVDSILFLVSFQIQREWVFK